MKTNEELRFEFSPIFVSFDIAAINAFLDRHPEFWGDQRMQAHLLDFAAANNFDVLRALVERGANINFDEMKVPSSRPLINAVYRNNTEMVRYLLGKGAEVNENYISRTYSSALTGAARDGNLEIVKLLCEASASINGLNNALMTPLSYALAAGKHEVADYLRSRGAIEAKDAPEYAEITARRKRPPIVEWVQKRLGEAHPLAWLPIIPDEVPVAVNAVFNEDHYCLFTNGMSERAMVTPPEMEHYQFAELVLYLDDWDTDVNAWQNPEQLWAINWVRRLTQIPFENNTWLGGKWTIISNEEPPQPLSEFTDMTCWLLLGEKKPLDRALLPDGKTVVFYTLMPIHTGERDYILREGLISFLRLFEKYDVHVHLDPSRQSMLRRDSSPS